VYVIVGAAIVLSNPRLGGMHQSNVEYENTLAVCSVCSLEQSMRMREEMVMADGLFKEG
jgi:hypothetical protein